MSKRFTAKNVALVCSFASIYAVLSYWYLFPIIGATGKFITMAVVMAPLIGIMLGPWLSVVTVTLGGIIGASIMQTGPFGPVSFIPKAATALCSGLLYNRKRWISAILYLTLLLMFTFYPVVGPAWLHPHFVWLQLVGLAVLVSPLQLKAVEFSRKQTNLQELIFGVSVISFTATLFGHVVGSMMFEMMYWPILIPQLDFWRSNWQVLTFIYPIERTIITVMAAVIGAPLFKALKAYGFEMGGGTHATSRDTDQAD